MAEENADSAQGGEPKKAPTTLRAILGTKIGMTQVFGRDGRLFDATIVAAGPCSVLRVKTADGADGYNAVQLGLGARKEKNVVKALAGQFKKAGAAPARWVREIRVAETKDFEPGQSLVVEGLFGLGDYVDVQGVSKGRGFAGVMKRHGFRGLPGSHGASDKERSPGSLTSRRALGRVLPGQRMAGHMGHETVSVQKLEVLKIDADSHFIYLGGSVPGPNGGLVTIKQTVKAKKHYTAPMKLAIKKDKMGNIIGKKPTAAKK